VTYRRRSSPLHAARAAIASLWCVAVSGVALGLGHPAVLLALFGAVLVAGRLARVGREVARGALFAVPFGVLIALVNALVVREGVTVLLALGELPPFGQIDVTLEGLTYGAVFGLQAIVVVTCFALHSAAVDPDDLLRAFRRISFRSALTAALATRMVPVLARDARRLADAQRCRPDAPAPRVAVLRAVATGALDRAADVAATLEVRGYGAARRPGRVVRPWSRHDAGFAVSLIAVVALAVAAAIWDLAPFEAYPRVSGAWNADVAIVAGALVAAALAPFADRRGIGRR